MNILFVSISGLPDMKGHSISLDLIHELTALGHKVYAVCANERRNKKPTTLSEEAGCSVLRVKVGNNKNTNIIEKGISNLMLPYQYVAAIKKYFSDVKFDLVLYPTPPVTQVKTVEYIKKRDNAKSYLMLKDIFPSSPMVRIFILKTSFTFTCSFISLTYVRETSDICTIPDLPSPISANAPKLVMVLIVPSKIAPTVNSICVLLPPKITYQYWV